MKIINIILSLVAFSSLNATNHTEDMLAEVDFIYRTMESGYAPAALKEELFGWNLKQETEKLKAEILNTPDISVKDYQIKLSKYFNSFRDDHVQISFFSTESSILPIEIRKLGSKYYISNVDSSLKHPIKMGDEIVELDGKTLDEWIKKTGPSNPTPTEIAKTLDDLIFHAGAHGHETVDGKVKVKIRHQNKSIKEYTLNWDHVPEKMVMKTPKPSLPLLMTQMVGGEDYIGMGSRKSFIPPLGQVVWQMDEAFPFHTYIYRNDQNRLIGYIRIPHYMMTEKQVEQFGHMISLLEDETDALVIDEVCNPGGLLFECYGMLSYLAKDSMETPKHHVALTTRTVFEAIELEEVASLAKSHEDARELFGTTFLGYPVDIHFVEQVLDYCRVIQEDWKEGKTFSRPTCLLSVSSVTPHPKGTYTKPILVCVNEKDFSGGDFFPAVLQDNKRAKIFGTRTAGAGGYVSSYSHNSKFGVKQFRLTQSLAIRKDGTPLETLGVQPDYPYDITLDDLTHQYRGYKKAVNDALKEMLN